MKNPPQPQLSALIEELKEREGIHIKECVPVQGGLNNRLYRLIDETGQSRVAKFYFQDNRKRLEREYQFLSLLNAQQFSQVPKPILQSSSLYCGVYEWIEGVKKPAEEFTTKDLDALADFLCSLHRLDHLSLGKTLPDAFMATFSMEDSQKNIEQRISWIQEDISNRTLHPAVLDFLNTEHSLERVREASQKLSTELTQERMQRILPQEHKRISTIDFVPENTLFRPDGSPVFIDFEYAGIDHPLRGIVDYLNHERTAAISPILKKNFLKRYFLNANLPPEIQEWFEPMRRWSLIEWHMLHIVSLRRAKIDQFRFSCPDSFEEDAYVQKQLEKARRSLIAFLNPNTI